MGQILGPAPVLLAVQRGQETGITDQLEILLAWEEVDQSFVATTILSSLPNPSVEGRVGSVSRKKGVWLHCFPEIFE